MSPEHVLLLTTFPCILYLYTSQLFQFSLIFVARPKTFNIIILFDGTCSVVVLFHYLRGIKSILDLKMAQPRALGLNQSSKTVLMI